MEQVTITSINGHEVKGKDEDGIEILVKKFDRISDLKVGDLVEGFLLKDDTNPDDFYLEAVRRFIQLREPVKCPHCRSLVILHPGCVACDGTGLVEKELYDRYYALATKLRNKIQIPYKYFEIENLVLVNISFSEDPNRYQEYGVYRRDEDGGYTKIESITVNGTRTQSPILELSALLMSISKQPLSNFESQIRAYDDKLTADEYEAFKKRFAAHEAAY
ncbi:hypothetical protein [Paenibacillus taichungensis]